MIRQVFLDTETTGIDPKDHKVIEIGAVEVINRKLTGKTFHQYINPQRSIDAGAFKVHGISLDSLQEQPVFAQIADQLIAFIEDAEVIMHNASFDEKFLDSEFKRIDGLRPMSQYCRVVDSLAIARSLYPKQKNSLDALCKRLGVSNEHRTLHGALIDASILAEVYLKMTANQEELNLDQLNKNNQKRRLANKLVKTKVIQPTNNEIERLKAFLEKHID